MKNVDLNAGGIIGAVLAIAVVLAGWILLTGAQGRMVKLVPVAAIGGGLAGNWIWAKLRPRTVPEVEETSSAERRGYLKAEPLQRVYRTSGFLRWFLSLTLLPMGCLLILGGVVVLFSPEIANRGIASSVGFLMAGLFLVMWLWLFRLKLEIGDDALRLTGLLGTKEIPLSQVAGYTLEEGGLRQAIKLVDKSGSCLGRIHSHLAGFPSILSWVERRRWQ